MDSQQINVDCNDLNGLQAQYRAAAAEYRKSSTAFMTNEDPSFGLVMQMFRPSYMEAKQQTLGYLNNVGQMLGYLQGAIDNQSKEFAKTENDIQDELKKILKSAEERKESSESHASQGGGGAAMSGGGIGGAGIAGGGYSGGAGGSGGGSFGGRTGAEDGSGGGALGSASTDAGESGATSPDEQDRAETTMRVPTGVPRTAASVDSASAPATGLSGTDAAHAPRDPSAGDTPNLSGGQSAGDHMHMRDPHTAADGTNTVGIDVTGDAKDEYSVNLTDGATHAVKEADGSLRLSKADSASDGMPLPKGAAAKNGPTFTLDANGDGNADVSLNPDASADSRISVYERDDGSFAAIDFDNDGDYDSVVRIGESEASRARMQEQAQAAAWEQIAGKDPLGRSANELRALFENRDRLQMPERDGISLKP